MNHYEPKISIRAAAFRINSFIYFNNKGRASNLLSVPPVESRPGIFFRFAHSDQVTRMLASEWLTVIMWPGCWPLIGWEWSCDQDAGLWLAESDHVTRILASDWLLPGSVLLPRTQPLQPPLWSRVWGVVNKLCELGILTMIQSYKDETDIAALCHFASIAAPGTGWLGTGSRHFYCLYWVIRRHRDTKRQKI